MQFTDHQLVNLDGALRRARFRAGPAQHADAQRVLAMLEACGRLPATPEALAAYLAPIYCANADQQQRFPDLLKEALEGNTPRPGPNFQPKRPILGTNFFQVLRAWFPVLVGLSVVGIAAATLAYLLWPHTLAGQVVSGGKPLPGAQIQLSHPASVQQTDDDGRFAFTVKRLDWPPGIWFGLENQPTERRPKVRANKAGHLEAEIPVERIDHLAHQLELFPEPPATPPPPPPKAPDIEFVYASPPAPVPTAELRQVQDRPRLLPAQLAIDFIPLIVFLGWWAYWLLRRQAWLQRLPGNPTQHVKDLSAGARYSLAFALDNAAVAHELRRRHWQPSVRLNVDASIRESLRRAGGMKMVFGSRVEPEYLALIDESCASDHLGRLGDALMLSLENRDVLLKRYYFKDNLLLCDGPAVERQPRMPGLPLVPLDVIHGAHSHRRLILISDGKPFFERLTGQPAPGVELLLQWPNSTLLTPVPIKDWGHLEWTLSQLGFTVLPLSARGLRILGELAGSEKPVPTVPGEDFESTTTPRWLNDEIGLLLPTPPVGMTPSELLADLRHFLGEDAYAWLQATAVYPEIHWGLTLRLGAGLFDDDHRFADALPRLARLIWLRQAYMPNWFRAALTSQLSAADWARVQVLLLAILKRADTSNTGDIPLRIASEPPLPAGIGQRLAGLFGRLGQDTNRSHGRAGRDTVYLRFLQGPPTLAVPAVEAIKRFFFRDGLWAAGVRAVPAGTLAALISAALCWQWWPWIQETHWVQDPPPKPAYVSALAMTGGADDPVLAGYSDGQVRRIERAGASAIDRLNEGVAGFDYADTNLTVVRLASGSSRGMALKAEFTGAAVGEFPFRAVVQKSSDKGDYLLRKATESLPSQSPRGMLVSNDGILCAGLTEGGNRRVVVTTERIDTIDAQGKPLTSVALPRPTAGCAIRPGADMVFGWNPANVSPVTIWRYSVRTGRLETPLPLAGGDPVSILSPSRDGRFLWVLQGNTVLALDGTSGKVFATLPVQAGTLAAAEDGQTVSLEQNGAIQIWRLTPRLGEAEIGRRIFLAITARYPGSDFELPTTLKEVDVLAKVLTERYGYEAVVLQDVSKAEVAARIEELTKKLSARDELILFFNGHAQPDQPGGKFVMFPSYDSKNKNYQSQGFSSDDLANWLVRIPVTNALTILDTVNARRARSGKAIDLTTLPPRSRWLLSSAGENEMSYMSFEWPTSIFINALVEALDKAKGPIPATDLLKASRTVLPAKAFPQTPSLDPMLGAGHSGGDFVLVPRNTAPAIDVPAAANVRLVANLEGHRNAVSDAAFSPDGLRIVTASGDSARLWRANGSPLAELKGHAGTVWHAAFSPDGKRIVTASGDKTARLWGAYGTPLAELKGHTGDVLHAAFSPDGQRIVTASEDNTARLWRADGTPLAELQGHAGPVTHAAFSPDGQRIVTAFAHNTARLWRVDGTPLAELTGHTEIVHHAAFSPDGQRILTASVDSARLWRADGTLVAEMKGHTGQVRHAAFSPDGQRIVTASGDKTARLWRADGTPLAELKGHTGDVLHAAFSPDGQRIVTASKDNTARLWRVDGTPLAELTGHTNGVNSAAFSPDNQRIVTASEDGTAKIWQIDEGQRDSKSGEAIAKPRDQPPDPVAPIPAKASAKASAKAISRPALK